MSASKVGISYCLHDDYWFLSASFYPFRVAGPVTVFVSRTAWDGTDGCWERCAEVATTAGAEVVLGDWPDESQHRAFALAEMKQRGYRHILIPDGDEVIEESLLKSVLQIAENDLADLVRVRMDTYWKSPRYVIRPREELAPLILVNCQTSEHLHIREYSGARTIVLGPEYGVLHHLSYAGPDERIKRKIASWGHRNEVGSDWYRSVWSGWNRDPLMRNLHPTHPPCYGFAERIETPPILAGAPDHGVNNDDPELPQNWPTVSVVIPLHGGPEDIRKCLVSLGDFKELIAEVIVVDDASPDDAASIVTEFPFARLYSNEKNLGFAGTCNRGYDESTGDVVLFLNSDTVVPKSGLIRLVESLISSGSIGAAGPMTNNAGYLQPTHVTYTDLSRLDFFAQDFAHRAEADEDVPILVGFCLAVRRSVLIELAKEFGEPPFDERFGRGLFEDNDLCYRIQRAGYRLRLAKRAYVHHTGSQSLGRMEEHPTTLLNRNMAVFHEKWREEIESGYASHLPGQKAETIVFRPELHPARLAERIKQLAAQADISLCMIVKNEERVLGSCLKSARNAFTQTIVIDTGSSDRTIEIAKSFSAEVRQLEWPESFAVARNESIRHATGKWIFWMDADDTLPISTVHALLNAAISAPDSVAGFVVPVQFVEDGPGFGTRVDHVKLFRNLPGLTWEGRIHEQILPSLRNYHSGVIVRLPHPVLHSGYDTSVEGQAKKRTRDWRLLNLDLAERPEHPFVRFNLGMTHHFSGEHELAVQRLQESIALAQPGESHIRKAYALMAISLRELGDSMGAEAALRTGLEAVGEDPELRFQLGLLLSTLNRFAESRDHYLLVTATTEDHFSSLDIAILGPKRDHNLGTVCMNLGKYSEAKAFWHRALNCSTPFFPSAFELFHAALLPDDVTSAREAMNLVERHLGRTEAWCELQIKYAEFLGESSEDRLDLIVRQNSSSNAPLLLLARHKLERGDDQSAEPILQELEHRGVAEAAFLRGIGQSRRGNFSLALVHMERALELNPAHEQTVRQVNALRQAVGVETLPLSLAEASPC